MLARSISYAAAKSKGKRDKRTKNPKAGERGYQNFHQGVSFGFTPPDSL